MSKLITSKVLFLLIHFGVLFISISTCLNSQNTIPNKTFQGFYLGVHPGVQNLFGGSFINGKDVLAQESKFVLDFSLGYRHQFLKNRLMIGLEGRFGFTDGNLSHVDPSQELVISYANNTQRGLGIQIGVILDKQKKFLTFIYVNETKRNFKVEIEEGQFAYRQNDKQGMLKYGLGVERQVYERLHAQFTIGKLRVDFGELETNIDVEDKLDITLGLTWNF